MDATTSVWPSGALRATCSVATLPAAPVRFSTTTGWPSPAVMPCATTRAVVSVLPPGAKPTTKRTGRSGLQAGPGEECCARAAAAGRRGTAASNGRRSRRFMDGCLPAGLWSPAVVRETTTVADDRGSINVASSLRQLCAFRSSEPPRRPSGRARPVAMVRRVGQRRPYRGQREQEAEALALVPQPDEFTAERRVASATPKGGKGTPARREEIGPGQRFRAGEALQRRSVALRLVVVRELERNVHRFRVEAQLVMPDAARVDDGLGFGKGAPPLVGRSQGPRERAEDDRAGEAGAARLAGDVEGAPEQPGGLVAPSLQ